MLSGTGRILRPANRLAERNSFGDVVLAGRLRRAIRRPNPAITSRTLGTLRDTLLPKLLRGIRLNCHVRWQYNGGNP